MYQAFLTIPAARAAIQDAFVKLYTKMPYEKMTIKLLCSEAHVARTTFYFHYNNLGEVREDIEGLLLQGLLEIADKSANGNFATMDFSQFAIETAEFINDNRDYVYAFLVAQPDPVFLAQWREEIKGHLRLEYPELRKKKNAELYYETFAASILTAYSYWMEHAPDEEDFQITSNVIQEIVDAVLREG